MMRDAFIYHIASIVDWQKAIEQGAYAADLLEKEGFIHASTREQIPGTAKIYFAGRADLVVLEIESAKLVSEIKYEKAPNGLDFPHIYGPINLEAVSGTQSLSVLDSGDLQLGEKHG